MIDAAREPKRTLKRETGFPFCAARIKQTVVRRRSLVKDEYPDITGLAMTLGQGGLDQVGDPVHTQPEAGEFPAPVRHPVRRRLIAVNRHEDQEPVLILLLLNQRNAGRSDQISAVARFPKRLQPDRIRFKIETDGSLVALQGLDKIDRKILFAPPGRHHDALGFAFGEAELGQAFRTGLAFIFRPLGKRDSWNPLKRLNRDIYFQRAHESTKFAPRYVFGSREEAPQRTEQGEGCGDLCIDRVCLIMGKPVEIGAPLGCLHSSDMEIREKGQDSPGARDQNDRDDRLYFWQADLLRRHSNSNPPHSPNLDSGRESTVNIEMVYLDKKI